MAMGYADCVLCTGGIFHPDSRCTGRRIFKSKKVDIPHPHMIGRRVRYDDGPGMCKVGRRDGNLDKYRLILKV